MHKRFCLVVFLLVLVSSCREHQKQGQESINGIWKSVGSGWILEINDATAYALYDITSISCMPNRKGDLNEILSSIHVEDDSLFLKKGVITYSFTRAEPLPLACSESLSAKKSESPLYNFEVFAETVRENYAFFELNDIDWNELYREQKEKLTENSTDLELYQVIEETLEKLNDKHGFLEATDEVYEEMETPQEPETEADTEALPEYGDFEVAQMVAAHHLRVEMTEDSWLIQWGELTDEIGFIQL